MTERQFQIAFER
jgi:hypothetical protein